MQACLDQNGYGFRYVFTRDHGMNAWRLLCGYGIQQTSYRVLFILNLLSLVLEKWRRSVLWSILPHNSVLTCAVLSCPLLWPIVSLVLSTVLSSFLCPLLRVLCSLSNVLWPLSCSVLSCLVLSCPVLSCPALSCHVRSCVLFCPVRSRPVLSFQKGSTVDKEPAVRVAFVVVCVFVFLPDRDAG